MISLLVLLGKQLYRLDKGMRTSLLTVTFTGFQWCTTLMPWISTIRGQCKHIVFEGI